MGLQLQLVAATIEANTSVSTNASVGYSIELALAWRGPLQPASVTIGDQIDCSVGACC